FHGRMPLSRPVVRPTASAAGAPPVHRPRRRDAACPPSPPPGGAPVPRLPPPGRPLSTASAARSAACPTATPAEHVGSGRDHDAREAAMTDLRKLLVVRPGDFQLAEVDPDG